MFYTEGRLCDYSDDGKVLSSYPNANIIKMIDRNDELLWTSYENAHHDLKFTNDQKAILLITSELIEFQNKKVRSDCFSKRDLNNKIIHQWCLSDNLKNLEKLGFKFYPNKGDPFAINELINTEYEISHANSIYEIKKNDLSDKIEAFQEGNFLVNIFTPTYALLILDKDLKNILWSKDLSDLKYGFNRLKINTHDSQITSDGKILTFANFSKIQYFSIIDDFFIRNDKPWLDFKTHSSLIKLDPVSDSIDWVYEATPPHNFISEFLGSVTQLKNNNYLFSDYTNGNAIYEVSTDGEIVWKLVLPTKTKENIRKTKPLYNTSFLKARGLIDQ